MIAQVGWYRMLTTGGHSIEQHARQNDTDKGHLVAVGERNEEEKCGWYKGGNGLKRFSDTSFAGKILSFDDEICGYSAQEIAEIKNLKLTFE